MGEPREPDVVLARELNLCRVVVDADWPAVGDTLPLLMVLARDKLILPVITLVGEVPSCDAVGFRFSISNFLIAMSTGRLRWSKPSPFGNMSEGWRSSMLSRVVTFSNWLPPNSRLLLALDVGSVADVLCPVPLNMCLFLSSAASSSFFLDPLPNRIFWKLSSFSL